MIRRKGRMYWLENGTQEEEAHLDARYERVPGGARWRGLGDVVAAVTALAGLAPCPPCAERRARLNALWPLGDGGASP